jgi:hypothetical protein
MNEIQQSDDGLVFGIAFQDNGLFWVSIITFEGNEIDRVNVSEILGDAIDDKSKGIPGFWEPLITCCFIKKTILFI